MTRLLPAAHMSSAALITLRETLEASLVVGIVLSYLRRTGQERYNGAVWWGVTGGILTSVVIAIVLSLISSSLSGRALELYEGVMMLTAAGLLVWMIAWMMRQRHRIKHEIESKVEEHVQNDHMLGLFFLALTSTAREGAETVIFLQALMAQGAQWTHWIGAVAGVGVAIVFSYFLFRGLRLLPLRTIFSVTSVLLLVVAARLVVHGVEELEEAFEAPHAQEGHIES